MDLVSPIISSALEKIGEFLINDVFRLSSRVRQQVESVQRGLKRMESFLRDAGQRSTEDNEQMKNLVEEVTAIAFDAENAIQMFAFYAECKQRRGRFKKILYVFEDNFALREICGMIESIEKRIGEMSTGRLAYGPLQSIPGREAPPSSSMKRLQEYRRSAVVAESEQVIGFVKDADKLTLLLTTGDECRRVISIVAIGGAGKTTLAKKLYNCSRVKDHFTDTLAWVCVSQTYNVKELLQEVAVQVMRLSKTESSDLTIEALQERLSGYLRNRRYLVVLDDMWEKEAWDQLRAAFPDGKNGSRILLTTRTMEVASHADPGSHPHELPLLNEEESWDLFMNSVFPHKNKSHNRCPPEPNGTGREIVAKCGGLPLAIRVIGGLLSTKEETERAWQNVLGSLNRRLSQESLCMPILKLSYDNLPGHLKPCFLYLGIFPEDSEILVDRLMRLWMAEGFVQQRESCRESKEDVAEESLKELVSRSMVQVAKWEYDGTIVSCRIHDLLREFAISEAQQHHLFQIDGNPHVNASTSTTTTSNHVIRLGFHGKNHSLDQSSLPNLRSLLCFKEPLDQSSFPDLRSSLSFTEPFLGLLIGRSKWLRVLDLEGVRFSREEKFPDVFAAVPFLRYLDVGRSYFKSFPPSFYKIYYLETFVCYRIRLPVAICTMRRLRHLCAFWCCWEERVNVGLLKHLHTLEIRVGDWIEEESLKELSGLRNFKLCGSFVPYREVLANAVHRMVYLETLFLSEINNGEESSLPEFLPFTNHHSLHSITLVGQLKTLPEFPPNLTSLDMPIGWLEQDPFPTLEKLRNLRMLKIHGRVFGEKMISSAQGFPQLRDLVLVSLDSGIKDWIVEKGAMPALESLYIEECYKLKMLPEGFEYLTTLQHLSIRNRFWTTEASKPLRDRLQSETGADWYKIRHIPHVSILHMPWHWERNLTSVNGRYLMT